MEEEILQELQEIKKELQDIRSILEQNENKSDINVIVEKIQSSLINTFDKTE